MKVGRREFVVASGTAAAYALLPSHPVSGEMKMHGLIGKAVAIEGKRDELIKILLDGVSGMPGCLSYVVAKDPADKNAIWITEVWDSRESHDASLQTPVRQGRYRQGQAVVRKLRDEPDDRACGRPWPAEEMNEPIILFNLRNDRSGFRLSHRHVIEFSA